MIFKESFRDIKENNVGMDPRVDSSLARSFLQSGDVSWILAYSVVCRVWIDISQTLKEGVGVRDGGEHHHAVVGRETFQ